MKIQLVFLFVLYSLQFSCTPLKPSITAVEEKNEDTITQTSKEIIPIKQNTVRKASYTKHFKLTTSQGYRRYIERIYYGPQTEILKDFATFDTRKELLKENFIKFPMASFFSPTAISIPIDKRQQAETIYKTFVDTLFSNSDYVSERHIEIIVFGYTDESPIEEDSFLYKELLMQSQQKILSQTELFNLISYYRAKEIGSILSTLIQAKHENYHKHYNKFIVDIIQEGRGLEYPDHKRTYEIIDPKRRIAKVYWSITDL